jgi:hypothetical protein
VLLFRPIIIMLNEAPHEKLSKKAIKMTVQKAADLTHFPIAGILIGDKLNIIVSTLASTDPAVIRAFLDRANPFFRGQYDLAVRCGK